MRAEKLELASPTSSSKNEPTTVEYLELERHRLYSAAMNVKQMSLAYLKVELCAFEKVLRYVLTDSSTHTLKIPPMNVTAVTDHCSAKCYRQWGQRFPATTICFNTLFITCLPTDENYSWDDFLASGFWCFCYECIPRCIVVHRVRGNILSRKSVTSSRISIWWIRDVQ